MDEKEIDGYLQDGSPFGRHTKASVRGADFCGGSLGVGMGVACGLALGAKLSGHDWLTFVILGDGECYEGAVWEAVMFAGANCLNNLVVLLDRNGMALTDFTEKMLPLEPLSRKWDVFNWEAREIDGHDFAEILSALRDVRKRESDRPLCVIANTVKGNGIDFMLDKPLWHGQTPKGEDADRARALLRRGRP
jgi:transketolase